MTAISKSIHKFEDKFERSAERLAQRHPVLSFLTMFIGMPIFILSVVALSAMSVALPMSWLFGWL